MEDIKYYDVVTTGKLKGLFRYKNPLPSGKHKVMKVNAGTMHTVTTVTRQNKFREGDNVYISSHHGHGKAGDKYIVEVMSVDQNVIMYMLYNLENQKYATVPQTIVKAYDLSQVPNSLLPKEKKKKQKQPTWADQLSAVEQLEKMQAAEVDTYDPFTGISVIDMLPKVEVTKGNSVNFGVVNDSAMTLDQWGNSIKLFAKGGLVSQKKEKIYETVNSSKAEILAAVQETTDLALIYGYDNVSTVLNKTDDAVALTVIIKSTPKEK